MSHKETLDSRCITENGCTTNMRQPLPLYLSPSGMAVSAGMSVGLNWIVKQWQPCSKAAPGVLVKSYTCVFFLGLERAFHSALLGLGVLHIFCPLESFMEDFQEAELYSVHFMVLWGSFISLHPQRSQEAVSLSRFFFFPVEMQLNICLRKFLTQCIGASCTSRCSARHLLKAGAWHGKSPVLKWDGLRPAWPRSNLCVWGSKRRPFCSVYRMKQDNLLRCCEFLICFLIQKSCQGT